jgi:hypothetical protein
VGELRIKSPDSNAQIYINGSYAGRAHELKKIYLAPGTYNIEQRIGSDVQKQRLYVLANRNVTVEFGKPGTGSSAPLPPPSAPPNPPPAPQAYPQATQPAPAPQAYPQPTQPIMPAPDVDAPPQPAPAPAPEAPR